jgi:hypothetical protein
MMRHRPRSTFGEQLPHLSRTYHLGASQDSPNTSFGIARPMFLVLDLWHAEATWPGEAKDQTGSNTPRLERCASVRAIVEEDSSSIDRAAFRS